MGPWNSVGTVALSHVLGAGVKVMFGERTQ